MGRISVEPGRTAGGSRTFSAEFKLEFVREWSKCVERGAKVRLMREYDLCTSTVRPWLKAFGDGSLTPAQERVASRSRDMATMRARIASLESENERLRQKTSQAEAATQILGKAFELLEGITTSSDPDPQIPPMLMSADQYRAWLEGSRLS